MEKNNPKGDWNPGGDETAMRRKAIKDSLDQYADETGKRIVTCPHCGKKHSASNVGGASVGG